MDGRQATFFQKLFRSTFNCLMFVLRQITTIRHAPSLGSELLANNSLFYQ